METLSGEQVSRVCRLEEQGLVARNGPDRARTVVAVAGGYVCVSVAV